jgi:hypothetical protein
LYLETNAIVGIAADQQSDIAAAVFRGNVPILVPSCCLMESYGAVAYKIRDLDGLVRRLGSAIHDYGRNPANATTAGYIADLSDAQAAIALIQNDMQVRLADCIDRLAGIHAFFDPPARVVQRSARGPRLIDHPTDNLIAHAIVDHAQTRGDQSVFYTEDRKADSFASIVALLAAENVTLVHDFPALTAFLTASGFQYVTT